MTTPENTPATEAAPVWEEPQTGPGFSVNDGYDFGWITRVVESLSGKASK